MSGANRIAIELGRSSVDALVRALAGNTPINAAVVQLAIWQREDEIDQLALEIKWLKSALGRIQREEERDASA